MILVDQFQLIADISFSKKKSYHITETKIILLQTLNRAVGISKRDPEWFQRFTKKGELFKVRKSIITLIRVNYPN